MEKKEQFIGTEFRLKPSEKKLADSFFPKEILSKNIHLALGEAFMGKKVLIRLNDRRIIHCIGVLQGTELWIDEIQLKNRKKIRAGAYNDPGYAVFAAFVYAAKLMNIEKVEFNLGEEQDSLDDIYVIDETTVRCLYNLWIEKVKDLDMSAYQKLGKIEKGMPSGCIKYVEIDDEKMIMHFVEDVEEMTFTREEIPIIIKSFEYFYRRFPNLPDTFRYFYRTFYG